MMLALVLAVAMGSGQAAAGTQAATSVPLLQEDPAVTALALKIYGQMRAGKVDPALLSAQMNEGLTPEKLASVKPMFDQLGDPVKLTVEKRETIPQAVAWTYLAAFPSAQFHVVIALDAAGKVSGYWLRP